MISELLPFWEQKQRPSAEERRQLSPAGSALLRQWDRLVQEDGVLYRQVYRSDGTELICQVLLPSSLKEEVLTEVHQKHGHQGVERTLELHCQRCYWPGMADDVAEWCQRCERCQVAKATRPPARSLMGHLLASTDKRNLGHGFHGVGAYP